MPERDERLLRETPLSHRWRDGPEVLTIDDVILSPKGRRIWRAVARLPSCTPDPSPASRFGMTSGTGITVSHHRLWSHRLQEFLGDQPGTRPHGAGVPLGIAECRRHRRRRGCVRPCGGAIRSLRRSRQMPAALVVARDAMSYAGWSKRKCAMTFCVWPCSAWDRRNRPSSKSAASATCALRPRKRLREPPISGCWRESCIAAFRDSLWAASARRWIWSARSARSMRAASCDRGKRHLPCLV